MAGSPLMSPATALCAVTRYDQRYRMPAVARRSGFGVLVSNVPSIHQPAWHIVGHVAWSRMRDRRQMSELPEVIVWPGLLARIASMADDQGHGLWDQFVMLMMAAGPARERGSRYGDKPALFTGDREVAHLEAPGVIDLRLTRAGWTRVGADYADDPAVCRDPARRDWIELHLQSVSDLDRLRRLLSEAMISNG